MGMMRDPAGKFCSAAKAAGERQKIKKNINSVMEKRFFMGLSP
jgi:hypothetical protein